LDLSPWETFNRSVPILRTGNNAKLRVDSSTVHRLSVKSFFLDDNEAVPLALFQRFEQEDYLGYHPVVQTEALATVRVAAAGDDELEGLDKASNRSGQPQFLCLGPSAGPSRQENANSVRHTLCGDRQKQI
jgi:hypothetical protein